MTLGRDVGAYKRAWRAAGASWQDSSTRWRDQKATEFESRFWSVVETDEPALITALEDLEAAIERSERTLPNE